MLRADTLDVAGVLVRGWEDFTIDETGCTRSNVCSDETGCDNMGFESVSNASTFASLAGQGGDEAAGCGRPATGTGPSATDALMVLRRAVNLGTVEECPDCQCDVNNSGSVNATDALVVLQAAVSMEVTLSCPPCSGALECPAPTLCAQCTIDTDCSGGLACYPCADFCDDPSMSRCSSSSSFVLCDDGLY